MTDAEIEGLNKARAALARRRNAIAGSLGDADLAPVKAAEDLTRVLVAIEAVDRALIDAVRPHMPERITAPPAIAVPAKAADRTEPQTSASRAKTRVKAAVQADRERR